jgi:hypothetical protein
LLVCCFVGLRVFACLFLVGLFFTVAVNTTSVPPPVDDVDEETDNEDGDDTEKVTDDAGAEKKMGMSQSIVVLAIRSAILISLVAIAYVLLYHPDSVLFGLDR